MKLVKENLFEFTRNNDPLDTLNIGTNRSRTFTTIDEFSDYVISIIPKIIPQGLVKNDITYYSDDIEPSLKLGKYKLITNYIDKFNHQFLGAEYFWNKDPNLSDILGYDINNNFWVEWEGLFLKKYFKNRLKKQNL